MGLITQGYELVTSNVGDGDAIVTGTYFFRCRKPKASKSRKPPTLAKAGAGGFYSPQLLLLRNEVHNSSRYIELVRFGTHT